MKKDNNKCNSESNKIETFLSRKKIDEISKEIASMHNYELERMIQLYGKTKSVGVDVFVLNIMRHEIEVAIRSNKYFVENEFDLRYMDVWNYFNLYKYLQTHKNINIKNYPYVISPEKSFDLDLIEKHTNSFYQILRRWFMQSTTYDEFVESFMEEVRKMLKMVRPTNDYMCIRFAADVCFASFEFWVVYFYDQEYSNVKKKESLKEKWEKIKEKAKELAEKIEPYAKADLKGAAIGAVSGAIGGAISGAVAGGIGAGPGAAAGAAGCAVAGAIESSVNVHTENH